MSEPTYGKIEIIEPVIIKRKRFVCIKVLIHHPYQTLLRVVPGDVEMEEHVWVNPNYVAMVRAINLSITGQNDFGVGSEIVIGPEERLYSRHSVEEVVKMLEGGL